MGSYQTVQIVAFTATPIATDYVSLAPGYTFSNGSVAPAGSGPASSGTSLKITSNLSATVAASLMTLDLSTTGVTAGSYTSVTVDAFGRVTAGANPVVASSGTSTTITSALSAQVGTSNITLDLSATGVAAGSYNSVTVDTRGRVTAAAFIAPSSGTSLTWTSALSGTVGASNVTLDLSATGVTAGSYVTVSVDNRGRVTGGTTSVATTFVTGVWTSGVSSTNVQGLGSTWTVSRLSSANSIVATEVWASGISVGGGGTLIPAISSLSSRMGPFVINGSSTSFRVVTWAAVAGGDQILTTILPDAAASSMSSGLVLHSHCTVAGRFEFRISNVSTLVQNQSAKTFFFTRISPF